MEIQQEKLTAENNEAWGKVRELQEKSKEEERSHESTVTALQVRQWNMSLDTASHTTSEQFKEGGG